MTPIIQVDYLVETMTTVVEAKYPYRTNDPVMQVGCRIGKMVPVMQVEYPRRNDDRGHAGSVLR
jgi:hypothetical protein